MKEKEKVTNSAETAVGLFNDTLNGREKGGLFRFGFESKTPLIVFWALEFDLKLITEIGGTGLDGNGDITHRATPKKDVALDGGDLAGPVFGRRVIVLEDKDVCDEKEPTSLPEARLPALDLALCEPSVSVFGMDVLAPDEIGELSDVVVPRIVLCALHLSHDGLVPEVALELRLCAKDVLDEHRLARARLAEHAREWLFARVHHKRVEHGLETTVAQHDLCLHERGILCDAWHVSHVQVQMVLCEGRVEALPLALVRLPEDVCVVVHLLVGRLLGRPRGPR